jgi:poly-beta-1,6-N-acetyl-D-glucosamine biosynthesis protein PgaD
MNIIDGLQKKRIQYFEKFLTTVGWFVILGFILQIILSLILWLFNLSEFYQRLLIIDDGRYILWVLLITVGVSVGNFLVLHLWGIYNLKKFGPLNRRTFPENVTPEDISIHFDIPLETIDDMQNRKVIVLEETIV